MFKPALARLQPVLCRLGPVLSRFSLLILGALLHIYLIINALTLKQLIWTAFFEKFF